MRALIIFFALLLLAAEAGLSEAKATETLLYQEVKLERVIDGDTLIASGKRIRLWGINAPEKGKPFFDLSTKFLRSLLSEGTLYCRLLYLDRYKRDVMHCSIDEVDVGSAMVRWGMATDYKKYSEGFYEDDQNIAKLKKLGIWSSVK